MCIQIYNIHVYRYTYIDYRYTHRCCIAARQHLCMCIYSLCTYIYIHVCCIFVYTSVFTYIYISWNIRIHRYVRTRTYIHIHMHIHIHIPTHTHIHNLFQPNPDPDEVINPQEPRSRDSPMLREDGWFYWRFSNEDFPMKHSMDWWETLQETRIFPWTSWKNGVSCESFPETNPLKHEDYFKVCLVFDAWGG